MTLPRTSPKHICTSKKVQQGTAVQHVQLSRCSQHGVHHHGSGGQRQQHAACRVQRRSRVSYRLRRLSTGFKQIQPDSALLFLEAFGDLARVPPRFESGSRSSPPADWDCLIHAWQQVVRAKVEHSSLLHIMSELW